MNTNLDDQQKIRDLQEALKIAMRHWAGWLDDSHGVHPLDTDDDERDDWLRCETLLAR